MLYKIVQVSELLYLTALSSCTTQKDYFPNTIHGLIKNVIIYGVTSGS